MIWRVLVGDEKTAAVAPSDAFFAWLAPRTQHAEVAGLDPYRAAVVTLEGTALERWRAELARVRREWRAELGEHLSHERRLPREADVRHAILAGWIDHELDQDEHARTLTELEAVVELALKTGGLITGDRGLTPWV